MSISKKYDQYIQKGFQMIVSAFDKQSGNYEQEITKLKNDIKNLMKINKELKEKNNVYSQQIQILKQANAKLIEKLKRKEKGINRIITSLEDKQNTIDYNSNDISFHTIEKETEELLNSSDEIGNRTTRKSLSQSRNVIYSPLSESRSFGNYNLLLDNNAIIYKTQVTPLFSSSNEEKKFIKNCKDNLNNKIYHNIIMLLNSYKSGLLTSSEVLSKIRSILNHNKEMISSFSKCFI